MKNRDKTFEKSFHHRGQGHRLMGIIFSLIGFIWLANKFGWLPIKHVDVAIFLPIMILFLGVFMALRSVQPKLKRKGKASP